MHRFEVMITRKAEGKTGQAFIGNMTEEKSVELASKLASESFLFVVGSLGLGVVVRAGVLKALAAQDCGMAVTV
jgi:hypothetical protein